LKSNTTLEKVVRMDRFKGESIDRTNLSQLRW
jgi:hypothetical protein